MKKVIIIHGIYDDEIEADKPIPVLANSAWLPWLKQELITYGVSTEVPEMPSPIKPIYDEWKKILQQFDVDEKTILVGHSAGASFLIRWLSESSINISKLLLVAPWLDFANELETNFSAFSINPDLSNNIMNGITMFYSTDDDHSILDSVAKIKNEIKYVSIKEFSNRGHFDDFAGTKEFPELLKEIVK